MKMVWLKNYLVAVGKKQRGLIGRLYCLNGKPYFKNALITEIQKMNNLWPGYVLMGLALMTGGYAKKDKLEFDAIW